MKLYENSLCNGKLNLLLTDAKKCMLKITNNCMCTAKFQINGKHQEKRPLCVHLNLSKSKLEIQHGMKILNEGHSKTTQAENFKYLGIY